MEATVSDPKRDPGVTPEQMGVALRAALDKLSEVQDVYFHEHKDGTAAIDGHGIDLNEFARLIVEALKS
jgi:hypothetical protein